MTEELILEKKEAAPLWEEVEKRQANRQVYTRDGVEKEAVYYANAIHAAAEEQICQEEDGRYYRFGSGGFRGRFNREENSGELFCVEKDGCCLTVSALERGRRRTNMSVPKLVQENKGEYLVYEQVSHGTDYRYTADSSRIKEDIVIREKAAGYRYGFLLESRGLEMCCQEEERQLIFRSLETGEEVFMIPAPFMTDAAGVYSDKVNYEVRTVDADKTVLTIIADSDWINAQERAFPVTVDPQIMLAGSSGMSTYQWTEGSMSATGAVISVGTKHNVHYCYDNRMYMKLSMPQLPKNARIKKATLDLCQRERVGSNLRLCLYQVTGEINAGSCTPTVKEAMLDYVETSVGGNANHSFDITAAFDSMLRGETSYANLMLRAEQEKMSSPCYADMFGTSAANAPKLTVTYENGYDANRAASASHDLGAFGRASLELQSGILSVESEDMAWQGNRMPVSIRHTFTNALAGQQYTKNADIDLNTADFHAMHLGYGWKLNYMQSMMPKMFMHDGTQRSGYVYTDEAGAQIYLLESTEEYFKKTYKTENGTTEEYYLYEDLNDSGYLYDSYKRELYHCADTYSFDAAGRLTEIRDQNDNTVQIVYTDGKLTSIVDGAGRAFELDYGSSGKLTSITAPDGSVVSYTYTGENLTGITARDGSHTVLGYTNNLLTSAALYQTKTDTAYDYRVEYAYDSADRVRQIKELGMGGVNGQSASYTYNIASRTTTMRNTIDDGEKTLPITTVYTFDRDGVVLGSYAYTDAGEKMQVTPADTGINPYVNGVSYSSGTGNLLTNHNFQTLTGWNKVSGECGNLVAGAYTAMPAHALYGSSMLRMVETRNDAGRDGVYQLTNLLESGEYTFSAYVRLLADVERSGGTGGVFLRVTDTANNVLAEGERLLKKSEDYVRLVLPFTLQAAQSVKVWICAEGKTELYADAAQLEKNPFASPYNLLQNGNFFNGKENWNASSYATLHSLDSFIGKNSLALQGGLNVVRSVSQSVNVRTYTDVRESFTLSGFAKASAIPARDRGNGKNPQFRLTAKIVYTDNTTELHHADFSPDTSDWQYGFVRFAKTKYKAIKNLEVSCEYGYNAGTALFDCIQLVRDNYESGLTKYAFPAEYDVEETEQLSPESKKDTAPAFEEAVDAHGNRITETIFQEGKLGTIYRSFTYNADDPDFPGDNAGNDQIRITDERGNHTYFTVETETSRIQHVQDRCGNKTEFAYDENGRLAEITAKGRENLPLAKVYYSYDSHGALTDMMREDGANLSYLYNSYHKLLDAYYTATNSYVYYTYKDGNGRLKEISMRGANVSYVYNRFGQIMSETWKKGSQVTNRYKYVYDNNGQVVRVIDITGKKEYNYYYNKGSVISRIVESDVELNESEIIISKTPACTISYRYNEADTLTGKIIECPDFVQEYTYTLSQDGGLIVTGPEETISQYNTDHFGRKTSDELKFGSGYISRKYTYHAGKITEEHKKHKKVKSEPTTRLVDTVTFTDSYVGRGELDGRTLQYEYDGEQRIVKVTDSVEGVTEYIYNDLGQLTRETRNGVDTDVVYDEYNNIQSKGGKEYKYDSRYLDQLTKYGDEEITYNGTPNPEVYRGWRLTWNKESQLATATKGEQRLEFTYNVGNVRTGKKINGTEYQYVVDGSRLVKDGTTGAEYLYDSEKKACGMVYEGSVYYFAKNLQGDVIALTNSEGRVLAQYSYDAWGKCTITVAVQPTNSKYTEFTEIARANVFRYRSYIYDEDLGLYYLHNRYYDPEVGRFISEDPAKDGTNWYAYCNGDSVNYVDPTGLWAQVGATIWEAQRGDTLWRLSEIVYGNGSLWTTFGYQDSHTNLQVGEIIDITGRGRVGRNINGYVEFYGGGSLFPVAEPRIEYSYSLPASAPSKPSPPAANTPTQPTPSNPQNNSTPSTSSPGNGGGGGYKLNSGSGNNGKNEIYGPPVPVVPEYKPPITQPILPISPAPITGPIDGGPLSGLIHAGEAIVDAIPGVDTAAIGGFFLDFDKIGDTYHAKVDCWQSHFGYNDLYDFVFSLGTTMDKAKFDFKSGKKEYILWAWKGDYINLGAGAEMGIYERMTFFGIGLPHWKVNKDLAMKMSLKLYYCGKKVVDYAPREKQWWITGFNPNYTVYSIAFLTAIYTVTFNTKKMYDDFINSDSYLKRKSQWETVGKNTLNFRF